MTSCHQQVQQQLQQQDLTLTNSYDIVAVALVHELHAAHAAQVDKFIIYCLRSDAPQV